MCQRERALVSELLCEGEDIWVSGSKAGLSLPVLRRSEEGRSSSYLRREAWPGSERQRDGRVGAAGSLQPRLCSPLLYRF